MEKIRLVTTGEGMRLMNPLTKTQRQILEAFGVEEKEIKEYIARGD
jgi:hypothetical protein